MDRTGANGLKLLSALFRLPVVNVTAVAELLEVTFPTASRLVTLFEELGLLVEVTGQRRSRVYRYEPYLALFTDPAPSAEAGGRTRTGGVSPGRLSAGASRTPHR
jgi:hypothetical protein